MGGRPNLNNASMAKLVRIKEDLTLELREDGYPQFKRDVFPVGCRVGFGDVRAWLRKLDIGERQRWLRGKYELWAFQRILLQFVQTEAGRRRAKRQRALTVPAALQSGSMFELLSGRVPICPLLDGFLTGALRKVA